MWLFPLRTLPSPSLSVIGNTLKTGLMNQGIKVGPKSEIVCQWYVGIVKISLGHLIFLSPCHFIFHTRFLSHLSKPDLQVLEFQQKKCSVIYDLSCNLARVLEFCTHEIPQAFLSGADTNLRRLTELIVFILNHISSAEDAEFFDL